MAHLRGTILYPPPGHPHHQQPPSIVASNSSSNPTPRRRRPSGSASGGAGGSFMQGFIAQYTNPLVFFDQDPEIQQPAASGFVADSILEGFDLNQTPPRDGYAPFVQQDSAPIILTDV